MKISAIKPGPKPKTEEGDLDKRRRVSPPNVPKYNPPLKPHKPKNKKRKIGLRPAHYSFRKHKNKGITSGSSKECINAVIASSALVFSVP